MATTTQLPVTADMTDRQIAVRAAARHYPQGAPPELCERLVQMCLHVDQTPRGGWPETRQAALNAADAFPGLTEYDARQIAADVRRMRSERDAVKRQRQHAAEDVIAERHEELVASVVRLSQAARECPEPGQQDDYYVGPIRQARPDLDQTTVSAVSAACVRRMRAWWDTAAYQH